MKPENLSTQYERAVENELDIRGLFCALWSGKIWIVGITMLFVVLALIYSFLAKQEWSSTAITDKPTVNMLDKYYLQQQFLRSLDIDAASQSTTLLSAEITTEVYAEFTVQLGSYDSRREFWLQSDYYRQHQVGETKADAALLDELINTIQYIPRDGKKFFNDSIRLTAETAADANQLLRQYVAFANYRTIKNLNAGLQGAWTSRLDAQQALIKQQLAVVQATYQRGLRRLENALKIAAQQNITQTQITGEIDHLPDYELFLLGQTVLQARLDALKASGPVVDTDYDRNQERLTLLQAGPTLDKTFQSYRYLRTPEEPIKCDSPRRVFLLVLWGGIGMLLGAGVVLVQRINRQPV